MGDLLSSVQDQHVAYDRYHATCFDTPRTDVGKHREYFSHQPSVHSAMIPNRETGSDPRKENRFRLDPVLERKGSRDVQSGTTRTP